MFGANQVIPSKICHELSYRKAKSYIQTDRHDKQTHTCNDNTALFWKSKGYNSIISDNSSNQIIHHIRVRPLLWPKVGRIFTNMIQKRKSNLTSQVQCCLLLSQIVFKWTSMAYCPQKCDVETARHKCIYRTACHGWKSKWTVLKYVWKAPILAIIQPPEG